MEKLTEYDINLQSIDNFLKDGIVKLSFVAFRQEQWHMSKKSFDLGKVSVFPLAAISLATVMMLQSPSRPGPRLPPFNWLLLMLRFPLFWLLLLWSLFATVLRSFYWLNGRCLNSYINYSFPLFFL